MNKELRERDLLWCKALIATLGTDEIEKVTAEFNRIRPDKAVEHGVHLTALQLGLLAGWVAGIVIGLAAWLIFGGR